MLRIFGFLVASLLIPNFVFAYPIGPDPIPSPKQKFDPKVDYSKGDRTVPVLVALYTTIKDMEHSGTRKTFPDSRVPAYWKRTKSDLSEATYFSLGDEATGQYLNLSRCYDDILRLDWSSEDTVVFVGEMGSMAQKIFATLMHLHRMNQTSIASRRLAGGFLRVPNFREFYRAASEMQDPLIDYSRQPEFKDGEEHSFVLYDNDFQIIATEVSGVPNGDHKSRDFRYKITISFGKSKINYAARNWYPPSPTWYQAWPGWPKTPKPRSCMASLSDVLARLESTKP